MGFLNQLKLFNIKVYQKRQNVGCFVKFLCNHRYLVSLGQYCTLLVTVVFAF